MSRGNRIERDNLGEMDLDKSCLYGIHTKRARDNFNLDNRTVDQTLIRACGAVKLACAMTNRELGVWQDKKAHCIESACRELFEGKLDEHIIVDRLQGGAGTSLNMNINEVIANRALQLMHKQPGEYEFISPLDDINYQQSTNDTFPTALRLALLWKIENLEEQVVALQEAFQDKEKAFAHIVKIGRTQMQDAVLTTLGREMSAYAEALSRDRWRIYKCFERLRVVNLGGTAIGTGLGASRAFIFRAVNKLRDLTGIGFARADNLIDATQNSDVFVEVSAILKALATTLWKTCSDLRLLSSGPDAGLGEIRLPQKQAGSSIMPGKVNPVIPEAVTQAAMMVIGQDQIIAMAAAGGTLELNPFLPLIAACLLSNVDYLDRSCQTLRQHCIEGITADEEQCRRQVENATATATALVGRLGYSKTADLINQTHTSGKSIKQTAMDCNYLSEEEFNALLTPEAVCRLGTPDIKRRKT